MRLESGPLGLPETMIVLRSLLESLVETHDHTMVHGSVTPSNVIVNDGPHVQDATLVGFGHARSLPVTNPPSEKYLDGARYMSPEQTGVIAREVDRRSDLYSLGIVVFECLTGFPPFRATDVGELLRQHLSSRPPPLRSLGLSVPRSLDDMIQRLLQKDPDDRYQTARAVLADLNLLSAAIQGDIANPKIVVGAHDLRHTLTEPALVGRDAELDLLTQELFEARYGNGRLVVVTAESGGGKTRLLDEFCLQAASEGVWVLRGNGVDRVASQPLQVLAGVAREVVLAARDAPRIATEIRHGLGDHALPICRMLPELGEVLGVDATHTATYETDSQALGIEGLVALLDSLGTADRPAAIVLDDCQWIDEMSVRVLSAWAQDDERPNRMNVLVVIAAREENLTEHHPLQNLGAVTRLTLEPLRDDQIRHVVESMAGPVPAATMAEVISLSAGSPFMVIAVLRGLVESGALMPGEDGWHSEPSPEVTQASRHAAEFLSGRLELLTPQSQHLLASGAVLGREFDLPLAALLAGQTGAEATAAVLQAEQRHVVWRGENLRYAFVHDRLREAFLGALGAEELARLHRRAAEEIEAADPSRAFELSYHFDAGGLPERALPYAIASAEAARSRDDLELAERHYRIAERGAPVGDRTTRQNVTVSLGQVLMLRGNYEEARERLEAALALAKAIDDPIQSARVQGELGELAFKQDDIEDATRWIEQALGMLGESTPKRRGLLIGRVAWNLGIRLVCGFVLARWRGRQNEKARLAAHLYARLLYVWYFSERGSLFTLWVLLRQVTTAERCPPGRERAHAYGLYGGVIASTCPPMWRRAMRYVDRATDMHEQRRDQWGEGHALSMRGLVLCAAGRFAEGEKAAGDAMSSLRRSGDPWELYWAAMHKAACLYRLGNLTAAIETARSTHQAAVAMGDRQAEATTLEIWAKACGGQLDGEPIEAALRKSGADIQTRIALLQAKAVFLRARGRLGEAIESAEDAVSLTRKSRAMNMYLVSALPLLATFYREAVEQGSQLGRTRGHNLRRARKASRRAVRYAVIYRNERAHALREAAMIAALGGRRRAARRLFRASEAAAEKQGARAELAETLLQRSTVGFDMGWPEASDDLARGNAIRDELNPAAALDPNTVTLGLAQRFEALLAAGGPLVSAGSLDEIALAVEEAVRVLLRPEHYAVIGFGGRAVNFTQIGAPDWDVGQVLVRRAFESRRPVVLTETPADHDAGEPTQIAEPRSALCAPIIVDDEVLGYLVASHSRVAGVFGDEEMRLAQFIAHLAGAALEREHLRETSRARVVAAQEAERARVARDLHDEIGQGITSVLLGIHRVHTALFTEALDRRELLDQTEETQAITAEVLERVQRLAFELRPTVLDDLGLIAALRRLVDDVAARHDLAVDFALSHLAEADRLPPDLETTVYRVAQEALTNVARHAGVSTCSIVLARVHDRVRLVITDSGIGFDADTAAAGSLGLTGMAERAALVSGTVRITSSPGTGTVIVMEAPVD
jgi:signal transduction histidine kinase/tetratricopeptide (TPR) repeat protein